MLLGCLEVEGKTPEPRRGLHEGRCPCEAFGHSSDCSWALVFHCRVQVAQGVGPGAGLATG